MSSRRRDALLDHPHRLERDGDPEPAAREAGGVLDRDGGLAQCGDPALRLLDECRRRAAPTTTSTRSLAGTGLKKCRPMNRAGPAARRRWRRSTASWCCVARTASGATCSTRWKTASLSAASSGTASMTSSTWASSAVSAVVVSRAAAWSTLPSRRPRSAALPRLVTTRSRAACAVASSLSTTTTGQPAANERVRDAGAHPAAAVDADARGQSCGKSASRLRSGDRQDWGQGRSRSRALPWPTPTHMVASPRLAPARSSRPSRVTTIRVPEQPSGCPSAMAPPSALTSSSGPARGRGCRRSTGRRRPR